MSQFLNGVFEDLIQRSGRRCQTGNTPQGVGALSTRTRLLDKHNVLDNRSSLIRHDVHETDLFGGEGEHTSFVMAYLEVPEHPSRRKKRDQGIVAQTGCSRHICQPKGAPIFICHGIHGDNGLRVVENFFGGGFRRDGGAIDFDHVRGQSAEWDFAFQHATVFIVKHEADDLRLE